MSDVLRKLERERDYWKRVAAYLASCHAATLVREGALKGTPRSSLQRYESIARIAADMMDGRDHLAGSFYALSTPESAKQYCLDALKVGQ